MASGEVCIILYRCKRNGPRALFMTIVCPLTFSRCPDILDSRKGFAEGNSSWYLTRSPVERKTMSQIPLVQMVSNHSGRNQRELGRFEGWVIGVEDTPCVVHRG
jgi:hypothetical protein